MAKAHLHEGNLSLPSIYNNMISQRVPEAPFYQMDSCVVSSDMSGDKLTCLHVQSILAYQPFPSLFQFLLVIQSRAVACASAAAPGHPRTACVFASGMTAPEVGLVFGSTLGVNLFKIRLAATLAQSAPSAEPTGRPLGDILVAIQVPRSGSRLRLSVSLKLRCFSIESCEEDVESVSLGGDEGHPLI
jgi:hypothetical protein